MKLFEKPFAVIIAGYMVLAVLLIGGIRPTVADQSESSLPALQKERIAVMPFLKGRYGSDIHESLYCPVCQLSFEPDSLTPDCDRILTRYVQETLERRHEESAIPFREVTEAYEQIFKNDEKDTPLTLAQKVGKALKADYVFVGTVWKYRQRRGGTRAIQSPASVAFAVYLIDVASGEILWQESFAETQRSLSENILEARAFFEKGAKWVTADELALFGVNEIFKKFPF